MRKIFLLLTVISIFTAKTFAQQQVENEHLEDAYIPNPLKLSAGSPAYQYINSTVITTQVNINENGNNIINYLISNTI